MPLVRAEIFPSTVSRCSRGTDQIHVGDLASVTSATCGTPLLMSLFYTRNFLAQQGAHQI